MCDGVGEDSRHGIGHVDIWVGIINSLECVCLPLHCTYVRSNPCKRLSLLGIAQPVVESLFQVQGVSGKTTLIRGLFLEESRHVALIMFCKTCMKYYN